MVLLLIEKPRYSRTCYSRSPYRGVESSVFHQNDLNGKLNYIVLKCTHLVSTAYQNQSMGRQCSHPYLILSFICFLAPFTLVHTF